MTRKGAGPTPLSWSTSAWLMRHVIQVTRASQGTPLDDELLAPLRALLVARSALSLSKEFGVSTTALTRAAGGCRVLRGTQALIRSGLEQMRRRGAP